MTFRSLLHIQDICPVIPGTNAPFLAQVSTYNTFMLVNRNVTIRPETPSDYLAVAEINGLAFSRYHDLPGDTTHIPEITMVDAMRHMPGYQPKRSLVAELDGKVVGHIFFYPFITLVDGVLLRAVSLGPIAVHPAYQKQGVGAALITSGHEYCKEGGFIYSFLLGHDSYYPRFGYQTNMFGTCQLIIKSDRIPTFGSNLEMHPVRPEHLPALLQMWQDWFRDVDLALQPAETILDWIPHTNEITAYTLIKHGEIIGYIRYHRAEPAAPKLFLARDEAAVLGMLGHIKQLAAETGSDKVKLPVHPESIAVAEHLPIPWEPHLETWSAAMIRILDQDEPNIAAYCREVKSRERTPGLVIYPPCMEFA